MFGLHAFEPLSALPVMLLPKRRVEGNRQSIFEVGRNPGNAD